MIDPTIIQTCYEDQALRCIQIGLLCTQAESHLRPAMSTVTLMLSSDSVTYLPDPTKPAFVSSHVSGLSPASANASSSVSSAHIPPGPVSNANDSITDLVPS
jgi:hypothetical protein